MEAQKVFNDAQRLLNQMIDNSSLKGQGLVGFWHAQSEGDDINVYKHDVTVHKDTKPIATFHGLRQQVRVISNVLFNCSFRFRVRDGVILSDFRSKAAGLPLDLEDYFAKLMESLRHETAEEKTTGAITLFCTWLECWRKIVFKCNILSCFRTSSKNWFIPSAK